METRVALSESVLASVDELVSVTTQYGHGWVDGNHRAIPMLPSFQMRVLEFWAYQGIERRGGIGRVEEPTHPAHSLWVLFSLRHIGPADFVERPGIFNVLLFDSNPGAPLQEQGGPWPQAAYSGWRSAGFATISKPEQARR